MIISDDLLEELVNFQGEIYTFIKNKTASKDQVENLLRNIEKRRYNILNLIRLYNNNIKDEYNKIDNLDNRYMAKCDGKILKIYIPEVMPKYKQINNFTYKRILLNISEVAKPYCNLFKSDVFIYIKIYDNQQNWDIDNKFIKPIPDALVASNIIKDDSINSMFYCVRGFYSITPHTEVYVTNAKDSIAFLDKFS
ncbi:MAG: hypothetical protein Q4G09_00820 [Clostridia bacterium]|nr:hypothetical protein [Clostridia bacterium]